MAGRAGVYLCLALANELFGAGIPEMVIETLKPVDHTAEALDWPGSACSARNPS